MNRKSSIVGIWFILLFFLVCNFGCSKNSESKPALTPDQILTSNTWKIVEDHGLFNSTVINYQRGRSFNSSNLDGDSIRFKPDGTGSQWSGNPAALIPVNWQFINDQKTQLNVTLNFSPSFSLKYQWDFFVLAEDSIKYNASYNLNGNSDFETVVRVPN
ncbi:MAG: hypothetical protein C5B59_16840 [Bacteroidetes bacterium]|nr:MAG: hypothetical protein C5B59_16840 [Bacteroidota bacterium]